MKKKLTLVIVAIVLVAAIAVGGSLAYFTDTDDAKNVFTVGNVKIELTEDAWDNGGEADAETVYAGEALAKDPTVTNTGKNPCFVRVKVEGLGQFGTNKMITFETGYVSGALGTDWVDGNDGYFYYTKVLTSADQYDNEWNKGLLTKTPALFDQVRMPTGLTGTETNVEPIVVIAQAVQAQGARPSYTDVKAMTVAEIADWFDTCGMNATV